MKKHTQIFKRIGTILLAMLLTLTSLPISKMGGGDVAYAAPQLLEINYVYATPTATPGNEKVILQHTESGVDVDSPGTIDYKDIFTTNLGSADFTGMPVGGPADETKVSYWYAGKIDDTTDPYSVTVYAVPEIFNVILNYNGGKYPANTGAERKTIRYPGDLNSTHQPAPGTFNPTWLSYINDGTAGPVFTDTPVLAGYSFTGWYTEQSTLGGAPVGKKWNLDTDVAYAGLTLYAHWEEAVDVVYHYGAAPEYVLSGTAGAAGSVEWRWGSAKTTTLVSAANKDLLTSSFSDDPSIAGFTEWRLLKSDGNPIQNIDVADPDIKSAIGNSLDHHTLHVYAHYQSVTYLIKGGTEVFMGNPIPKRLDETPDYYVYTGGDYKGDKFSDWYNAAENGTKIKYGERLNQQGYTLDDALIYAQYRTQRQVTFLDGFGRTFRTFLVEKDSLLTDVTANDPLAFESFSAPQGKYFKAWSLDIFDPTKPPTNPPPTPAFTSTVHDIKVENDITLRPMLSDRIVYFNYTNASDGTPLPFTAIDLHDYTASGGSYTIPLDTAAREGYTFVGWSEAAKATGGPTQTTFLVPEAIEAGHIYYLFANGTVNWTAGHAGYTIAYWIEKPRLAIDDITPNDNALIHQAQSGWMKNDELKYYDKVGERVVDVTNSQINAGSPIPTSNTPADASAGTVITNPAIFKAAAVNAAGNYTTININNFFTTPATATMPVSATVAGNAVTNDAQYIQYYKTLGTTIAGDGTSVINVLYRRKVKTVTIYSSVVSGEWGANSSNYTTVLTITHNDTTYERNGNTNFRYNNTQIYAFNVKFEDDVKTLWPQMNEFGGKNQGTICARAKGDTQALYYCPVNISKELMDAIITDPKFNICYDGNGNTNQRWRINYVQATAAEWAAAVNATGNEAIYTATAATQLQSTATPNTGGTYRKNVITNGVNSGGNNPTNRIPNDRYVLQEKYTVNGFTNLNGNQLYETTSPIDGATRISGTGAGQTPALYYTTETRFDFYTRVEASIVYNPGVIKTAVVPSPVNTRYINPTYGSMPLRTGDEIIADWLAPPAIPIVTYAGVNYEFAGWSWVDQTKPLKKSDEDPVTHKYPIDDEVIDAATSVSNAEDKQLLKRDKNYIYAWWAEMPFTVTVIDRTEKVAIKNVVKRYLNETLDPYKDNDWQDPTAPGLVKGLKMDNMYDGSTPEYGDNTYTKWSSDHTQSVERKFNHWKTNFAGNFYAYEPTLSVTRDIEIIADYGIAPDYVQIWYLGDDRPEYDFPILMPSANLSAGIASGLSTILDEPTTPISGTGHKLFAGWQVIKYDGSKWVEVGSPIDPSKGEPMPIDMSMATLIKDMPDSPVINLPLSGNPALNGPPGSYRIPDGNYIFLKPIFATNIFWDDNFGKAPVVESHLFSGMTLNIPGNMPPDGMTDIINGKKYGMVGWYSVSKDDWDKYKDIKTTKANLPYTYASAKIGDFPSPTGDVIFTDSKAIKELKKMDQTIYLIARWVPVVTFDINDGSGQTKDVITNLDGTVTVPTEWKGPLYKTVNGQVRSLEGWYYWRGVDDTANASEDRPWEIDTTAGHKNQKWETGDVVSDLTTGRLKDIYTPATLSGEEKWNGGDTWKWGVGEQRNGVLMARWTAGTTVDIRTVPSGLTYDPESPTLGTTGDFITGEVKIQVRFTGMPTNGYRYLEISFACDTSVNPSGRLTISAERENSAPNDDPAAPPADGVMVRHLRAEGGGEVYEYTFKIPTALVWKTLNESGFALGVAPVDVYAEARSVSHTKLDDDTDVFSIKPINSEREKPAFPLR